MRQLTLALLMASGASAWVAAQAPRTAPPARPAPLTATPRLQLDVNAGVPVSSTFAHQDFAPEINRETASITNDIELRGGAFADVGGAYRVRPAFWIGGSVAFLSRTVESDLRALIPHPLYFNQPREIDATVSGLRNTETHLHAAISYQAPLSRSADLSLFGGPSLFRIAQDVVTAVNYDSVYPFDTATFASAATGTVRGSLFGFNAGARVGYRVSRALAITGLIRYERGTGTLDAGGGNEVATTAGGLKAAAGLRVSFCSSRPVPPRRRGGLLLC
jgi:hypothetical protein